VMAIVPVGVVVQAENGSARPRAAMTGRTRTASGVANETREV
jgi:hypothetical protein